MTPIHFPEVNLKIGVDQPEYFPIPAHKRANDPNGQIVFCWKLTDEEIAKIIVTKRIWHSVYTFNNGFQPVALEVTKPDLAPVE